MMKNENQTIQLVALAQSGNRQAMNQLAVVVRGRLDEYVGRVTLGSDHAGDIVQETLIVMVKSLNSLRRVDRFWPWLYKITANMIRRHYRNEKRHRGVSLTDVGEDTFYKGNRESDAVAEAVAQEMRDNVVECMSHLKPNYRMVLALRCYDRMPYAEIAEAMGQTDFGARRMFCRAKKALAKELTHCGLGRGALVMALLVFGQMSATSKASAAAISLTPSLLHVGTLATLSTAMATKAGLAAMVAGGIAVGASSIPLIHTLTHKTTPLQAPVQTIQTWRNLGIGRLDRWYFYPTGTDRQVLLSFTSRSRGHDGYRQWFQTHQGNYFKDGGTITLENYRYWNPDLSVMRLPSDPPALRAFLDRCEGVKTDMEYHPPHEGRMMVGIGLDAKNQQVVTQVLTYNVKDEERFRYLWSVHAPIVDKRDAMHQRGWTTFQIHGHLGSRRILGYGQIPFVAAEMDQHKPCLVLEMGMDLTYQDTPVGAQIRDAQDRIVARYPGGSFFAGLTRPWAGLHCIDTVRRDAARRGYRFTTELMDDPEKVRIHVDAHPLGLIYTINLTDDWIESIEFMNSGQSVGRWKFDYNQEPRTQTLRFLTGRNQPGRLNKMPGMDWLLKGAERDVSPEQRSGD